MRYEFLVATAIKSSIHTHDLVMGWMRNCHPKIAWWKPMEGKSPTLEVREKNEGLNRIKQHMVVRVLSTEALSRAQGRRGGANFGIRCPISCTGPRDLRTRMAFRIGPWKAQVRFAHWLILFSGNWKPWLLYSFYFLHNGTWIWWFHLINMAGYGT